MIKNILFGSDGSPYGEVAGQYAFDLADRLDARLEAVHVVDSRRMEAAMPTHAAACLAWTPPGISEQLRQMLEERGRAILAGIAAEGEKRGIPVVTTLEFGVPPPRFSSKSRCGRSWWCWGGAGNMPRPVGTSQGPRWSASCGVRRAAAW